MSNVQNNLNAAFPGANAGDAVLDETSGYYWEYDGSLWVQKTQGIWNVVNIDAEIEPYVLKERYNLRLQLGINVDTFDYKRVSITSDEVSLGLTIGGFLVEPNAIYVNPISPVNRAVVMANIPLVGSGSLVSVDETPQIEIVQFIPIVEGGDDKIITLTDFIEITVNAFEPVIDTVVTTVNINVSNIAVSAPDPLVVAIQDPFYNSVNFILGDGGETLNSNSPQGRVYLDRSANFYDIYQLDFVDEYANFVNGKEYFGNHRPLNVAENTNLDSPRDLDQDGDYYYLWDARTDWEVLNKQITVLEEALRIDFNEYTTGELGVNYTSSVKDHGQGSYSFVGKSSWLEWVANDSDKYGAGDFTLEWWQFLLPEEINRSTAGYSDGVTYENQITFTKNGAINSSHDKRFDYYEKHSIPASVDPNKQGLAYENSPRIGRKGWGRGQGFLAEPSSDSIRLFYSTDFKYIPDFNLNLSPGNTIDFFVDGTPVTATVATYTQQESQQWAGENVVIPGVGASNYVDRMDPAAWVTTLITFSDYTFPANNVVHEVRFSLQQNGFSVISLADDERLTERHVCNLVKFDNNKIKLNRKANNALSNTINGDNFYSYVSLVFLFNEFSGTFVNHYQTVTDINIFDYSPNSFKVDQFEASFSNYDQSGLQFGDTRQCYDPAGYFDIRAFNPVTGSTVADDEYSTTEHTISIYVTGTDYHAQQQELLMGTVGQFAGNVEYFWWSQDNSNWNIARATSTTLGTGQRTYTLVNGWPLDGTTNKTLYIRRLLRDTDEGRPLLDLDYQTSDDLKELIKYTAPRVFYEDWCVEFSLHPMSLVHDNGGAGFVDNEFTLSDEQYFVLKSYGYQDNSGNGTITRSELRLIGEYTQSTNSKSLTEAAFKLKLEFDDPYPIANQGTFDTYSVECEVAAYEGGGYQISESNPVVVASEADRWYHIALTYQSGIFTIFVNGVPKASLNEFKNINTLDADRQGKEEKPNSWDLWSGKWHDINPEADYGNNVEFMEIYGEAPASGQRITPMAGFRLTKGNSRYGAIIAEEDPTGTLDKAEFTPPTTIPTYGGAIHNNPPYLEIPVQNAQGASPWLTKTWQHVAISRTNQVYDIYVDGNKVGTDSSEFDEFVFAEVPTSAPIENSWLVFADRIEISILDINNTDLTTNFAKFASRFIGETLEFYIDDVFIVSGVVESFSYDLTKGTIVTVGNTAEAALLVATAGDLKILSPGFVQPLNSIGSSWYNFDGYRDFKTSTLNGFINNLRSTKASRYGNGSTITPDTLFPGALRTPLSETGNTEIPSSANIALQASGQVDGSGNFIDLSPNSHTLTLRDSTSNVASNIDRWSNCTAHAQYAAGFDALSSSNEYDFTGYLGIIDPLATESLGRWGFFDLHDVGKDAPRDPDDYLVVLSLEIRSDSDGPFANETSNPMIEALDVNTPGCIWVKFQEAPNTWLRFDYTRIDKSSKFRQFTGPSPTFTATLVSEDPYITYTFIENIDGEHNYDRWRNAVYEETGVWQDYPTASTWIDVSVTNPITTADPGSISPSIVTGHPLGTTPVFNIEPGHWLEVISPAANLTLNQEPFTIEYWLWVDQHPEAITPGNAGFFPMDVTANPELAPRLYVDWDEPANARYCGSALGTWDLDLVNPQTVNSINRIPYEGFDRDKIIDKMAYWGPVKGRSFTISDVFATFGSNIKRKQWYHIAYTRDSNDEIRLFVNGKLTGDPHFCADYAEKRTDTVNSRKLVGTKNFTQPLNVINTAWLNNVNPNEIRGLDGYIADLLVVKGEALYVEDFEVPSLPTYERFRQDEGVMLTSQDVVAFKVKAEIPSIGDPNAQQFIDPQITIVTQQQYSTGNTFALTLDPTQRYTNALGNPEFNIILYASSGPGQTLNTPQVTDGSGANIGAWTVLTQATVSVAVWQYKGDIVPDGNGDYTINWEISGGGETVPINWGLHRGTEFDWDIRNATPGGFYDGVNLTSWPTDASGDGKVTSQAQAIDSVRSCPIPAKAPWDAYFGPEYQVTNITCADLSLENPGTIRTTLPSIHNSNPPFNVNGGSYCIDRLNVSQEEWDGNTPRNYTTNISCYYGYQRPWHVLSADASGSDTSNLFHQDLLNGSRGFSFSSTGNFETNQNYSHPTFGSWPMDALSNYQYYLHYHGGPTDIIGLHRWNWKELNANGNTDFHGTTVPSNQDHIWWINWFYPKLVPVDLPGGSGVVGQSGKPSTCKMRLPGNGSNVREHVASDLDVYFAPSALVGDDIGVQDYLGQTTDQAWQSIDYDYTPFPYSSLIGYGIPNNNQASGTVGNEFDTYKYWHRVTVSFTKTYTVDEHVTASTGDGSNCYTVDYNGANRVNQDCNVYGGDPPAIFGIGRNDCSLRVACDAAYAVREESYPLLAVYDYNNYRTTSSPFDCNWLAPDDGNIRTESFWIHPYTVEQLEYGATNVADQLYAPMFSFISDGGGGGGSARSGVGITAATYQISPKIKFWGMMLHNGDITAGGSNVNEITGKDGTSLPASGYRSMSYLDSDLTEANSTGFIVTGTNTTGAFSLSSTLADAGSYDCLTGPNPCYDNFSYWDAPFRPRGNIVDNGQGAASTYNPRSTDILRIRVQANQGIYSGGASVQGSGGTLRISKIGYMDKETGAVTYQSLNTTDSPSWTPNGGIQEVDFLFTNLGTTVFNSAMWGEIGLFELEYTGGATSGIIVYSASMEYVNDSYQTSGSGPAVDLNVTCITFNTEDIDTDQIIADGISSNVSDTSPTTYTVTSGNKTNWIANEVTSNQTTAVIPAPPGQSSQEFYLSMIAHPGTLDDPAMGTINMPQQVDQTSVAPFGKTGIAQADRGSEVVTQFSYGYRNSLQTVQSNTITLPAANPYFATTISYNYRNIVEQALFSTWYDLMVAEDMFHEDLVNDATWKDLLSQAYSAACNAVGGSRVAYYAGLKTPYGNRLMNGEMRDGILTKNYRFTDPTYDNAVDRTFDYSIQHKKDDGNFYEADFEWRSGPLGGPGNRYMQFIADPDGLDAATTRTNLETDMFLEMGRNPNAGEDANQGNQYWLNNFYIPDGKYSITNDRVDIWENGNTDYSLVYGLKGNPGTGAFIQNKPKGLFNTAPYFNSWSNIGFVGNKVYPTYTINGHEMFYEHRYGVDGILPQWEMDLGSHFQYFQSAFLTEYGGRHFSRGGTGRDMYKTISFHRYDWDRQQLYGDDSDVFTSFRKADHQMSGYTLGAWEFNHAENIQCLFGREVTSYGWSPGVWSPTFYGSNVGNMTNDYCFKGQFQGRSRDTFTGTTTRFDLGLDTHSGSTDQWREGANEMPWDTAYLNKRMVQWIGGSGKNSNAIYIGCHGFGWYEKPFVIHQSDASFLRTGLNGHKNYSWGASADNFGFFNGFANTRHNSDHGTQHGIYQYFQGVSRSDWPIGNVTNMRNWATRPGGYSSFQDQPRTYLSPWSWTQGNPQGNNHIGYFQVVDAAQSDLVQTASPGHNCAQVYDDWRWRYASLQVNGINTSELTSTSYASAVTQYPSSEYGSASGITEYANFWGSIRNAATTDTNIIFGGVSNPGALGSWSFNLDDPFNRQIYPDCWAGLNDEPVTGSSLSTNMNSTSQTTSSTALTVENTRKGWNPRVMTMSFNSILKAGRDEVHEPRYSSARIFALDAGIAPDNDDWSDENWDDYYNAPERYINGDLTTAHTNLFNFLKQKFADYDPIQED